MDWSIPNEEPAPITFKRQGITQVAKFCQTTTEIYCFGHGCNGDAASFNNLLEVDEHLVKKHIIKNK